MISERNNNSMVTDSTLRTPEDIRLGSRIECCGYIGTVKYIGPITGYKGLWLGIDWDDVTRGKHNGTVDGVEYFKASHLKSGSFVRCEKVNFGQSIINAILSKYGQCDNLELEEQVLLAFKKTTNTPFLEMVGLEKVAKKQSNFHELKEVNLRMCNISLLGGANLLKDLCPNINELDLSKNLFSTWLDIFSICKQLEHLRILQVSENILNIPENCSDYQCSNINILICAHMNLNWNDLKKITQVFNNIEELIVPYNNITAIDSIESANLQNLKKIDMEGNEINWDNIMRLNVCPNLKEMNLTSTQINCIRFDDSNSKKVNVFEQLKKLIINRNNINEWQSVGELNRLKNLEDLRFVFNPVLEKENLETNRQIITARIANLKILNGCTIDALFRKGAEYDYIKKYGLEWLQIKDNEAKRNNFLKQHNRYLELIEQHGSAEESELKVQSNILNSSLINLKLVYGDKVIIKKFPPTLPVQKLIMLCQKLFKLNDRPKLIYKSDETNIEICLTDEMKEIDYYSIRDNDKLIVQL